MNVEIKNEYDLKKVHPYSQEYLLNKLSSILQLGRSDNGYIDYDPKYSRNEYNSYERRPNTPSYDNYNRYDDENLRQPYQTKRPNYPSGTYRPYVKTYEAPYGTNTYSPHHEESYSRINAPGYNNYEVKNSDYKCTLKPYRPSNTAKPYVSPTPKYEESYQSVSYPDIHTHRTSSSRPYVSNQRYSNYKKSDTAKSTYEKEYNEPSYKESYSGNSKSVPYISDLEYPNEEKPYEPKQQYSHYNKESASRAYESKPKAASCLTDLPYTNEKESYKEDELYVQVPKPKLYKRVKIQKKPKIYVKPVGKQYNSQYEKPYNADEEYPSYENTYKQKQSYDKKPYSKKVFLKTAPYPRKNNGYQVSSYENQEYDDLPTSYNPNRYESLQRHNSPVYDTVELLKQSHRKGFSNIETNILPRKSYSDGNDHFNYRKSKVNEAYLDEYNERLTDLDSDQRYNTNDNIKYSDQYHDDLYHQDPYAKDREIYDNYGSSRVLYPSKRAFNKNNEGKTKVKDKLNVQIPNNQKETKEDEKPASDNKDDEKFMELNEADSFESKEDNKADRSYHKNVKINNDDWTKNKNEKKNNQEFVVDPKILNLIKKIMQKEKEIDDEQSEDTDRYVRQSLDVDNSDLVDPDFNEENSQILSMIESPDHESIASIRTRRHSKLPMIKLKIKTIKSFLRLLSFIVKGKQKVRKAQVKNKVHRANRKHKKQQSGKKRFGDSGRSSRIFGRSW